MSQVSIKCLENKTNNDGSLYGKFSIEPFERGFGATVGNSLRRILLSTIPGSAVTSVRVEGITHEFSAIPGVVEDVIDILLNLKGLAVKSYSDVPQILRLKKEGAGPVLAKDIEASGEVQVINPDWHIATLSGDGKLEMEITVENGVGYVPAEQQEAQNRSIDVIPIDSVFMPVKKVSCSISNNRSPEGVEYDSLTIEIWTNGTVEPSAAIGLAASKFIEKLAPIAQSSGEAISIPTGTETVAAPVQEDTVEDKRSALSIEELELSVRAYNCLKRANINSLGELLSLSYNELMNIKNFGRKSADEVIERLHAMGLHLIDETPPPGDFDPQGGEGDAQPSGFQTEPQLQAGSGIQDPFNQ